MTNGQPTNEHHREAEAVAGSQFRYRSATDRSRIVDRIAWALAEAEDRGRRSVGLGDFVVTTCDEEARSPYDIDVYGAWLPCTRREGHDGEHEHSGSGYTWSDDA